MGSFHLHALYYDRHSAAIGCPSCASCVFQPLTGAAPWLPFQSLSSWGKAFYPVRPGQGPVREGATKGILEGIFNFRFYSRDVISVNGMFSPHGDRERSSLPSSNLTK